MLWLKCKTISNFDPDSNKWGLQIKLKDNIAVGPYISTQGCMHVRVCLFLDLPL